jgi:hypothetical protein
MCFYIYFDLEKIKKDYFWDGFILELKVKTNLNNTFSI